MTNDRLLPDLPDVVAPDGSLVRILTATAHGSMAHFSLGEGLVSKAVRHRSVEEIWYILGGTGQMWRSGPDGDNTIELVAGQSLVIAVNTSFQFRSFGPGDLQAVAVTIPPWPGMDEAELVPGIWQS